MFRCRLERGTNGLVANSANAPVPKQVSSSEETPGGTRSGAAQSTTATTTTRDEPGALFTTPLSSPCPSKLYIDHLLERSDIQEHRHIGGSVFTVGKSQLNTHCYHEVLTDVAKRAVQ